MDKKIMKLKAKESSFVMKLTKKDIVEILSRAGGYTLNEHLISESDGKILPAIERGYNEEKNQYQIFVRCSQNNPSINALYSSISQSMPNMAKVMNPNDCCVIISDFDITFLGVFADLDQENKQLSFARFMYNKFGEYYREKYNKHVRKQIKEQKGQEKE